MENKLLSIEAEPITLADGSDGQAIFIACNIYNMGEAVNFVFSEVAGAFRRTRLLSGGINMLLVTMLGGMSAQQFSDAWLARCRQDKLLLAFMSDINQASVVHGTKDGETLGEVSLLP
jgi:hypothetical protein